MTKVKICGITSVRDARLAVKCGADMIGFNFYDKSPRFISPSAVLEIVSEMPEGIVKVGLFVNEGRERILEDCEVSGMDAIQLHGDEDSAFVTSLAQTTDREIIKAIRVHEGFAVEDAAIFDTTVLLDAFSTETYGGTGHTFNWEIAAQVREVVPRLILAGGLRPDNVTDAIRLVRPYAVDVASGVESSPGKKDPKKLEAFIRNAKDT